jgi:hypothetical protein
MKPRAVNPLSLRRLVPLAFLVGCGVVPAAEPEHATAPAAVQVGVRSHVDERWQGIRKGGPIEHGKVYLVASLKGAPSESKLVRPVDEAGLLAKLRQTLDSHGFRETTPADTPDVVLTVLYGRGYLRNPYLANIDGDINSVGLAPTTLESLRAAMIDPSLYGKRSWGTYEHKVQAAQKEKLFIRVTAWKFPGDRKEKPAELWKTTMVVDEPDRHDLNELYPHMLAAGAQFFDQPMKEEEVIVSREGRVNLAPLIILESGEKVRPTVDRDPDRRSR